MIELATHSHFARGDNRLCFVHPHDASLCIKVNRADNTPEMRRNDKGGWYRTLDYYDENLRDARSLVALEAFYHGGPFPKFRGWVETDFGRGLMMDLVRDEDGEISKTLEHYFFHAQRVEEVRTALAGLTNFLAAEGCVLRGVNPHNILVRCGASGMRLVIIDNLQLHAASTWWRGVARRRARHVMLDLQRQLEAMRRASPRLMEAANLPIPFLERTP